MKIPRDLIRAKSEFDSVVGNAHLKDLVPQERTPWFSGKELIVLPHRHLISLHNHSDGRDYSLEQIARAGAEKGFKILGVTDHNSDEKFEGKRLLHFDFGRGIYLLRGMEARCYEDGNMQGDVLLAGYDGKIEPFRPLEETVRKCVEQGGIVIATTPFNFTMGGIGRGLLASIAEHLTAIEILNSTSNMGWWKFADAYAREFAFDHSLTGIYEQDAHTLDEIGLAGFSLPKGALSYIRKVELATLYPSYAVAELRSALSDGRDVRNHGGYMPVLSVFYPEKFKTLSHKGCKLKPGD